MRLIEYAEEVFWCGAVFRCRGAYPFEETVDFMLTEANSEKTKFAIYCISGYYAGTLKTVLPDDALSIEHTAIKTNWVMDNWKTYIYEDCSINEVSVFYPSYVRCE
jgi:hypothetical protein